jgi:hypothetical protein
VELGLGDVEQGGCLDQREVVLEAEGAEAEAEVARRSEDELVEGSAIVRGVFFADEFVEGVLRRVEEEVGIEVGQEVEEAVVVGVAAELGGVARREAGGVFQDRLNLAFWQEQAKEAHGGFRR